MPLSAKPEDMQSFGKMLMGMSMQDPPVATLSGDGPLSAGLSSAHSVKQSAALNFVHAANEGVTAAGQALMTIGADLTDYDRKGAAGIQEVLPAAQPGKQ